MFARGKTAEVWPQRTDNNTSHQYFARQGINGRQSEGMIPLNAYTKTNGRRFNVEQIQPNSCGRRRRIIQRLNSAPELHSPPELPPIQRTTKNSMEKLSRPLTPLVLNSGRNSSSSSRSLPKNYRINLDLTPLIEVGTCNENVAFERERQTSLCSSDSYLSSGSPRRQSLSSSSRPEMASTGHGTSSPRSTGSMESMEDPEAEGDNGSLLDENGKDTMILRWLQTIDKNNETTTGDFLPSITEGRLS